MSLTSKQLGILLVCLCAITLTVAWIIERRQILAFRQELDAWGVTPPGSAQTLGGRSGQVEGYAVDYPIASSPSVDAGDDDGSDDSFEAPE